MAQSNVEIALQLVDKLSPDLQKLFKMINKDLDFIQKKSEKTEIIPKTQIQQSKSVLDAITKLAKKTQESISNTFKKPIKFEDLAIESAKIFAVGYPFKKAIKHFADFETDMSRISMVIPHITDNMMRQIEKNIFHLAQKIGKTIPDITAGYKLILQGLPDLSVDQKIIEADKLMLLTEKAAQAYGVSAETISNAMIELRQITPEFQKNGDLMETFFNKIVIGSHETGASFQDMVYQLNNFNLAKISGFSEEQFVALSSNMVAATGVGHGGEAQRAMRNIMLQLIKPLQSDNVTKNIRTALDALGIDVKKAQKMVKEDSYGFTKLFFSSIQDLMTTNKVEALKALKPFGAYTVQGASKLATTMVNVDRTLAAVGDKTRQNTELNNAYNKSVENISNLWIETSNTFQQFQIKFIEPLKPAMASILNFVKSTLIGFTGIIEKFPIISKLIAGIVGSIIALRGIILTIKFTSWVLGINSAIKTIAGLNIGIKLATNAMTLLGSMLGYSIANPVILAVVGTISSLTWVLKKFGATWKDVWREVKDVFKPVFDWIVDKLSTLKNLFSSMFGNIVYPDFLPKLKTQLLGGELVKRQEIKDKPNYANWGQKIEATLLGPEQFMKMQKMKENNMLRGAKLLEKQEMKIKVEVDQNGTVQNVKATHNNKPVSTELSNNYNKSYYNNNPLLVADY